MSQKIILRAGSKEITGPEFRPAAITKGQKHVFNVEETKNPEKAISGHCGKQNSVNDKKTRKVDL